MGTLLFGLPLLAAYSNVDPGFFFGALIPYLGVSLVLAFLFLVRPIGRGRAGPPHPRPSAIAGRFNQIPSYAILALVTATVAVFGAMRYQIYSVYLTLRPLPPPSLGASTSFCLPSPRPSDSPRRYTPASHCSQKSFGSVSMLSWRSSCP